VILVTGASGFIGRHVCRALTERGDVVVQVDPRSPASMLSLDELLRGGMDVEAVVHLGAITDTMCDDEERLLATNVELPRRLWQSCTESGATLVFASSAAVYGSGERGFSEREWLLTPLNAYGRSKLTFDRWASVLAEGMQQPTSWAGLRFFNVYGPGEEQKGPMASMVSKAVWAARLGVPLSLFQWGEQRRDFVYVGDVVKVILWLLDNLDRGRSGIYNVGTGRATSFAEVVEAVGDVSVEWLPMPEAIRSRFQHYTRAELDRLREAGYAEPFLPIERGLERYRPAEEAE
jgi:ADP-L-glycero-D-manno-heptose 6-epimerase